MAESRGPGSDLPAEYVDPWRLLRRDLRAVLASLRLRLRELWRRNHEADLWRPGFWPEALAAWFWPLLLILLLSLTLLPIVLAQRQPLSPAPSRSPESSPLIVPPSAMGPAMVAPTAIDSAEPDVPEPRAPQSRPSENLTRASPPAPPLPPEPPVPPVPPEARPDPLLMALEPDGAPSLLIEARPLPALALLQLTLAPEFARLTAEQRRQRSLDWWAGARRLGYERLELRDPHDRLLARSALVGEGLVLFEGEGGDDA